jgi:hypothetical protein
MMSITPAKDVTPAIEDARNLLRTVQEELVAARANNSLAPSAKASLITSAARAIKLIASLSGEGQITEVQIIRSAPWQRLMAALDGVLVKHPKAARDWANALAKIIEK